MFDALAADAERRGIARVAIVNGDIIVTTDAVRRIVESPHPAVAVARTDMGGGEPEAPLLYGVDMIAVDVAFWRRERRRFRAYPLGETVWDNVYTAIVVAHGGTLLNRSRLILHERHTPSRANSPFAAYVHLLAARDRSYFTLWCIYADQAAALRARGGSEVDELALQRAIFQPPGMMAGVVDVGRAAWWRLRQAFDK